MTVDELAAWLVDHGFAEERRGYGHVSGEELAKVLLDNFVMAKVTKE